MVVSFSEGVLLVPSGVVARAVDGECVLLNAATGRYFKLDEFGTRAWEILTSAPSIQAGYETLLAEYDADADDLRHDLEALIKTLLSLGLVDIGCVER